MLEKICQKQYKWKKKIEKADRNIAFPENNFFPDNLTYWEKTICWNFSLSLLPPL